MDCSVRIGYKRKIVPFFLILGLVYGCATDSEPSLLNPSVAPSSVNTAALLAASRSATASRLLREALVADNELDLCEGLITHNKRMAIERVKKPAYMDYHEDGSFGSRSIRITDSEFGEVRKPLYSSVNAWNADESLILLHRFRSGRDDYVLLDGHNYEVVKSLDFPVSEIRQVFWSHTDPDIIFYVSVAPENRGWFMRYNVGTGDRRRVRNFEPICGSSVPSSGNNVQMQSLDNDLFGFHCKLSVGDAFFSYRVSSDSVHQIQNSDGITLESNYAPMPSPSGASMEIQGYVLPPELNKSVHKLDQAVFHEHASLGQTATGQDALFQTIFDPSPKGCNGSKHAGVAHLAEFDLNSGKCRAVVSQADGWPYTTKGTHVSALARHRPGWVAMSSIGYGNFGYFTDTGKAPPLTSEIYLVNTDPADTRVCRLLQHRSYAREAVNGDYPPHLGEPHVTISPSGTRLIFATDWYDSGAVDTHVIELPPYTKSIGTAELN